MEKFFDKKIAAAQINRNSFFFLAEQLLILMVVMILLSVVALFLFIGACMYDRVYIMPWIWTKYFFVFIQIMRFITIIIQLSTSVKNPAGPSPIFELVLLGKLHRPLKYLKCHFSFSEFRLQRFFTQHCPGTCRRI